MKTIYKIVIIFTLTFLQSYWAMFPYRNQPDSYSMNNSYFKETLYISLLFTALLIPIILITNYFTITKKYQNIILIFLLVPEWYLINYGTYDGRVASWSSYSSEEINGAVIGHSFFPIVVFVVIFLFLYQKFFNIKK